MNRYITGNAEFQILTNGETPAVCWDRCQKYPDHNGFTAASDFTVSHLPSDCRDDKLHSCIKLMSDLTVRLKIRGTASSSSIAGSSHEDNDAPSVTRVCTGFFSYFNILSWASTFENNLVCKQTSSLNYAQTADNEGLSDSVHELDLGTIKEHIVSEMDSEEMKAFVRHICCKNFRHLYLLVWRTVESVNDRRAYCFGVLKYVMTIFYENRSVLTLQDIIDNMDLSRDMFRDDGISCRDPASTSDDATTNISVDTTPKIPVDPTTNISDDAKTNISGDSLTNITEDATPNISDDPAANISDETTTNISDEATTNISDDSLINITEDATTNISYDATNDATSNISGDATTNISDDATNDATSDISGDATTNISCDSLNNISGDATTNISGDSPTDITDESTTNKSDYSTTTITDDTTTSISGDSITKLSDDTTTKISDDTTTKISDDTTTKISDDTTTKISDDTTTNISDDTTTNIADDSTTIIIDEGTTNISGDSTTNITADTTTSISGDSTTNITDDVAANISDNAACNIPDNTTSNISDGPTTSNSADSTTSNVDNSSSRSSFVKADLTPVCPCPCPECKSITNPQPAGYVFDILTDRRAVHENQEAANTVVDLEFRGELKHLYGQTVHRVSDFCDLQCLRCVTHEVELADWIKDTSVEFEEVYRQVRTEVSRPLAVICSYPHGNGKMVSVGEWTARFSHDCCQTPPLTYVSYTYTTPTCPGSMGAPVLILGQTENYRRVFNEVQTQYGTISRDENKSGVGLALRYQPKSS